jgi:hypothetical protein
MKDNRAEKIISSKIKAEESGSGLLEDNDALWSVLNKRLEKKVVTPKPQYYTVWAAASVVFLLILGFCLYPTQKTDKVQETASVGSVVIDTPVLLRGQAEEKTEPVPQEVALRTEKKVTGPKRKLKEPGKEVQEPAAAYAGLYAMPQIACADVSADNYPQCSQTL